MRTFIFGVGLMKTGTRSTADALRILGFRTLHRGGPAAHEPVAAAIAAGEPPLARLGEDFDAYFNTAAFASQFALLDEAYPGSKFLLTTRDVAAWLDSCERHARANQQRPDYVGDLDVVDRRDWTAWWHRHHAAVRAHFADRPEDLLEFDATRGEWGDLPAFLGRATPRMAFPHENRRGAGTYRPATLLHQLRRLPRRLAGRLRRPLTSD